MKRGRRAATASLVALALCLAQAPASRGAEADAELAALESAVSAHPGDRDLDWAWIRRLEELARVDAAATALEAHLARWPGHPADADVTLGRWLLQLDRDAEAVAALERGLARAAATGAAPAPMHLHFGLALRALGRPGAALAHFEQALLSEALRADARLLAGLVRLDLGDRDGAKRDFERLVAEAPASSAARSARLLLAGEIGIFRWIALEARAAGEYDSNVTLESVDLPGVGDRDDFRFRWGASAELTPPLPGGTTLGFGAHYDESAHLDLDRYDTRRFAGSLSAGAPLGSRVRFEAAGLAAWYQLAGDPYLLHFAVRPGLLLDLGSSAGALQAYAEYEHFDYCDKAPLPALERDGETTGAGLRYFAALPGWERWIRAPWISPGLFYAREDDRGHGELLSNVFENAYDHHRFGGELRAGADLALGLALEVQISAEGQRYDNENVIDFLFGGSGEKRRDTVVELSGEVRRPIGRYVELELFGAHWMDLSNVSVFEYDRTIVGLGFRLRSPR